MSTYVLSGKYSLEAIRSMNADRTARGREIIKKFGGEVQAMYALLGEKDLLIIASFPDGKSAIQASAALCKITGISFITSEAFPVEQFDKIMSKI